MERVDYSNHERSNKMAVASKAYWETNLNKFKLVEGNREIVEKKVKEIATSMRQNGYLVEKPIIVNEKLEILDGQHRVEAAKRVGIAVAYNVKTGGTLLDCIRYNSMETKWKLPQYITAYAVNGDTSYRYLQNLVKAFPDLSLENITRVTGNGDSDTIKNGRFSMSAGEYQETCAALTYACSFVDDLNTAKGHKGNKYRAYMAAILFCYGREEVDNDLLRARVHTNRNMLTGATNIAACIENLDEIYNYRTTRNKTVNITALYRENGKRGKKK